MTTSDAFPKTTTAHTVRLCLFQPTRRPQMLQREPVVTQWGEIRVTGRLGQRHADLFEVLCWEHEQKGTLEDGRVKLLVDPARVRQCAGVTGGRQFDEAITELQAAVIEIIEPQELACSGHLIDHIDKAQRRDGTYIMRANPLGGERHIWRVEIGKAFCKLVAKDIWLGYDPAPIARMPVGIAQAIARHVMTHKNDPHGGWKLDTLIHAVAPDVGGASLRNRRRELRAAAADLAAVGIIIKDGRVWREIV